MVFATRRLTLGDMDEAAQVHRAAFDERLPWLSGLHTPGEDRAYFRGHVFSTCEVWGALDGEILVGFIAFRERWIDQLYVAPEAQGHGVGAALLALAKAAFSPICLWTFQRNAGARRFYEANGFVAVEMTDGAGNDECEPDVRYQWERAPIPT